MRFRVAARPCPTRSRRRRARVAVAVAVALAYAAGLMLSSVPPAAASSTDALDVGFGGSFSLGNSYTAATGETMLGHLDRLAGTETLDPTTGLVLAGGQTGATFSPTDTSLLGGGTTLSRSFVAEVVFTPSANQLPLATVVAVGNNLFARYQDGQLRYGFSSYTSGSWSDYTASAPVPSSGVSHALALAYLVDGTNVSLHAFLDGSELPPVASTSGPAASGSPALIDIGTQAQVNSGDAGRGLSGSVRQARVSVLTSIFTGGDIRYQHVTVTATDALDVGFGGSFSLGNSYTAATGETMLGHLDRLAGTETLDPTTGLVLAGGQTGATFSPTDTSLLGGTTLSRSFVAEVVFTPSANQLPFATVVAVGGNLFARYQDGQLRYGFSSYTSGSWSDYTASAPVPSSGVSHALALAYLVDGTNVSLHAFLDGSELPPVASTSGPAAPGSPALIGIGTEVNSGGAGRGLSGSVRQARVSVLTSIFTGGDIRYQHVIRFFTATNPLLNVAFQNTVADGAYTPTFGEVAHGSVTISHATQSVAGSATFSGAGSGVVWAATGLPIPHLSGQLRTEVVVGPDVLASPGTLVDLGGGIVLSRSGANAVALTSGAVTAQRTLPAPQTEDGMTFWHLTILSDLDSAGTGTVQLLAGSTPLGDPISVTAVQATSSVRFLADVTGTAYGVAVTLGGTSDASSLGNLPCTAQPVDPAHSITVTPGECVSSLLAKASAVRPTTQQVNWQRAQQTAFLHFGINTFTGNEWGFGNEDPDLFQPTKLDTDQWAKTLKDNGFKIAILVVKHHDGFVLFPSRYTDHSVRSSSWMDGKGDVLKMFAASMRAQGIGVGVYLSPADESQELKGVFGNGSAAVDRTIPTLVPGDDRTADTGLKTFQYKATDYGSYFLNQLYEVLTQYGPISEVWFDGAQGRTTHHEAYDFTAYYDLIRQLMPDAVIAVSGPDVRWVGNESGLARENEWSVIPMKGQATGEPQIVPSATTADLGSDVATVSAVAAGATRLQWYPAEVDVSIHSGWFWHDDQQPRSVADLTNIYYKSAGRNSVLLLNIPPNKDGLLDARDVTRLAQWRNQLWHDMPTDLALHALASGRDQVVLTDGKDDTSTIVLPGGQVSVQLAAPQRVDKVVLGEDIGAGGMQIRSVRVEALVDGSWTSVVSGGSVGYQRIFPLTTAVTASKFRVTVTSARGPAHLARVSLYGAVTLDQPVDMSGNLGGQKDIKPAR